MVLLLNYLPMLIAAALLYWGYRRYKAGKSFDVQIILTVVALVAHSALLPSYMPKGTQQRLPPVTQPVLQETPAPIVDLAPKPVPLEQRKQEQLEAYKRGLPFATPANTSSAPAAK